MEAERVGQSATVIGAQLDVQKERAVSDAIRSLNLTRIIIAHRPETIASAERPPRIAPRPKCQNS